MGYDKFKDACSGAVPLTERRAGSAICRTPGRCSKKEISQALWFSARNGSEVLRRSRRTRWRRHKAKDRRYAPTPKSGICQWNRDDSVPASRSFHHKRRRSKAHPVVPGSPICGMRMPSAAGARGHLVAASDRRLDSPTGPKGRRYCHRHADKQPKAPEKLETHPPFQISLATPIC